MNPYAKPNVIDTALNTATNVIGLQDALQQRKDRTEDRRIAAEDRDQQRGLRDLQIEGERMRLDKGKKDAEREQQLRDTMSEYGRAVSRFTALSEPETFNAVAGFAEAMQNGDRDGMAAAYPGAIAAYSRINDSEYNVGLGEKVHGTDDVIVGKRVADFMSTKRGTHVPVLEVTAKRPDGTLYTYQAPRTDGTTNPKAAVREHADDDLIGHMEGAIETGMAIQDGSLNRQQLDDFYRSKLVSLGMSPKEADEFIGKPKAEGQPFETVNSAGKLVYAQRFSDGSVREMAGFTPDRRMAEAKLDTEKARAAAARALTDSRKAAKGASGGTGSAKIDYNKYIADVMFKGDEAKAARWIKAGDPSRIAASIARSLYDAQKDDRQIKFGNAPRRSYDEFLKEVTTAISEEQGLGGGADDAQLAPQPGDADEPVVDYSELWGD